MTKTTITKEQLDSLWTAMEYTMGTIGTGCVFESETDSDWVEIHRGRAFQSRVYLDSAKSIVNKLRKEINDSETQGET